MITFTYYIEQIDYCGEVEVMYEPDGFEPLQIIDEYGNEVSNLIPSSDYRAIEAMAMEKAGEVYLFPEY
jgi:hypothetical protein